LLRLKSDLSLFLRSPLVLAIHVILCILNISTPIYYLEGLAALLARVYVAGVVGSGEGVSGSVKLGAIAVTRHFLRKKQNTHTHCSIRRAPFENHGKYRL
jgi:hypothetical protein